MKKRLLAVAVAALIGAMPVAHAQWVVIDPTNLAQNILTAAHTLEQINNQIKQLQNEAQSLMNEARNLASLPFNVVNRLRSNLDTTRQLIGQARGLAFDIQNMDQQFAQLYPEQYAATVSGNRMFQDAHQRWQNTLQGLQTAMRMQAQVLQNLNQDEGVRQLTDAAMNDVSVIDHFLNVFSTYIDSGFGLLHGEVAFLTATLVAIDMTLAGLYWALAHATGQGEDVMAKLLRKVLYVGAFAYIIGNFNWLASIVFRSFAGLGLTASGSTMSMATFLQPGRLAKTGIDAAAPILQQISEMAGFPEVFINIAPIVVMFLAWLIVIISFFVLAVQLFVTLIEFKLTTLAGFVLVPFALWNKTAFLAEKVLGNVVSSGIKVLVLAVIVGIGTGLFAEFQVTPSEPSVDHALVVMLASLAMLALGIFGPGIATGLVSGAPQLGAGAMAGAAMGAAGTAIAVGAAATGVGSAVAAGARMAPAAAKMAGNARSAYQAGSAAAGGGLKGAAAGVGNVAKTGAQAVGQKAAAGMRSLKERAASAFRSDEAGPPSGGAAASGQSTANEANAGAADPQQQAQPAWAKRLHRRQQISHAATTAAHTLRGGDGGGSSSGPSLHSSDD